ncbi:MAG: serine/threonine-protein phosphatase [Treponema sp.]|nr:serine/threonine-protein phosphatase [Treponema sp.]
MIFLLLNLIAFAFTLRLAFHTDKKIELAKYSTDLVNLTLFLSILFLFSAVMISLSLWGPAQLSLFLGRVTIFLFACYSISASIYMVSFPRTNRQKPNVFLYIFRWAAFILAFYLVFFAKGSILSLGMNDKRFIFRSGFIFRGAMRRTFHYTWFDLLSAIYIYAVPCFFLLLAAIKAENTDARLLRQKRIITIIGVPLSWITWYYINWASEYQPLLFSLFTFTFIPQIILFSYGSSLETLWTPLSFIKSTARIGIRYLLPAALGGLLFLALADLYRQNLPLFMILYVTGVSIITFFWYYLDRFIQSRDFLRDNNYSSEFEKAITSINYDDEPQAITEHVYSTFQRYLDSSSVSLLTDNGSENELETVYSSNGTTVTLKVDPSVFDTLLNMNHPVVFREWLMQNSSVSNIRSYALDILAKTNSDAFIILNEGRQIVAVLTLGKKRNGNVYSVYDYEVLNKFYSNIFVVGYYFKNIMNEAVIGTVNREIRMSDQIITSIQENMDFIKNPKADIGYLMVPAHNIGGEFVDMIRLNDQRYIFIIGALNGKGIAASMNMVILKSIIRTFLAETTDFKLLVEKVNTFIRESLPKGSFFAGTFGLIDFTSDTLYYINCGAPALFMYTKTYNNVIEIQGAGRILGFVQDIGPLIKVKKVKLSEGDMILACTDGLIESRSLRGDVYGKSNIQSNFMENSGYPANKMAQFAYDSLVHFTSKELDDDITILIIKYHGGK